MLARQIHALIYGCSLADAIFGHMAPTSDRACAPVVNIC